MGGASRYTGGTGIGHRLELLPPARRHELAVEVMKRIMLVSALPASPDRSAELRGLRPMLERLCD
jgi:hypothetical protein